MALIKSKLRLPHSLSHSKILKTFSFSSSTSEPTLQEDDTDNDNSKTTPTTTTTLNPEETLIAEKFHALIKDHHHKNPNLDHMIPTLSLDFSQISTVHPITPPIVRRVLEKCGGVRYGIPFLQALSFFNWATAQDIILPHIIRIRNRVNK